MRFLMKSLLALGALLALGLGAVWAFLPTDRILALAAEQVRAATGRELTVTGAARPDLWPQLGISVEGLALSNADWAEGASMLTAESAQISIAIGPLLSGDIEVTGLQLQRPSVSLEIGADGRRNWDFPPTGVSGAGRRIGIDLAEITDGALRFRDRRSGRDIALTEVGGALSLPASGAPMVLNATARINGAPASVALTLAAPGAAFAGGRSAATLDISAAGARIEWSGDASGGAAPMLRGTLSASGPAPGAVLRDPGLDDPRALALSGQLELSQTGGSLRGGRLRVDHLTGALDAEFDLTGARPALNGVLTVGAADLRPWMKGAPRSGGAGWSRTPIDISGLTALDLTLSVAAGPITTPRATIAQLDATLDIKDGAALLTLSRAEAFGGVLTGDARIAPHDDGVAASGALTAEGIALSPALTALSGAAPLDGVGDIHAEFAAQGPHMDALMHDLSGAGRADLRDGALRGVDLAVLVRNILTGASQGARTDFTALTASWTVAEGQLRNRDLHMTGPLIALTGAGRIGIGARDLDYRVTPHAIAPIAGLIPSKGLQGLSFPVNIHGPWSAPSFTPDLARAIPGLLIAPAAMTVDGLTGAAGVGGAIIGGGLDALLGGNGATAPAGDTAPKDRASPLDAFKGMLHPFKK